MAKKSRRGRRARETWHVGHVARAAGLVDPQTGEPYQGTEEAPSNREQRRLQRLRTTKRQPTRVSRSLPRGGREQAGLSQEFVDEFVDELLIDDGEAVTIDCGEHGTVVATSREDALDKLVEIFGHGHNLNLDAYLEVRGLLANSLNKLQWAAEQPLEEVEETPKPRRKSRVVERGYERKHKLVDLAKHRADYRCEVAGCTVELFTKPDGQRYVEVHHLIGMAEGGPDTLENLVCVCANHHRELHYGERKEELKKQLQQLRAKEGGEG